MLSMQIDSLRSHADLYDGTTKPEMAKELQRPYLAQELREAADTIWELRDDLQRANAENAKLREQIHWLKKGDILHVLTDQEYIDQCERERLMQVSIDALDKENAKLREELADAPKCETCEAMLDCDECLRADGSHKERRRLKAENAKLRELCEDMLSCIEIQIAFDLTPKKRMYKEFAGRARELGVEVDE